MAINYDPVGWDTTKYVNPTNMNKMDGGIKAACDGVDKHESDIAALNSNLDSATLTVGDNRYVFTQGQLNVTNKAADTWKPIAASDVLLQGAYKVSELLDGKIAKTRVSEIGYNPDFGGAYITIDGYSHKIPFDVSNDDLVKWANINSYIPISYNDPGSIAIPFAGNGWWTAYIGESGADANNIKVSGTANTVDGWSNLPNAEFQELPDSWGTLISIFSDGANGMHLWFGMNSNNRLFKRNWRYGNWTKWYEISSTNILSPTNSFKVADCNSSNFNYEYTPSSNGILSVYSEGAANDRYVFARIRMSTNKYAGQSNGFTLPAYSSEPVLSFHVVAGVKYAINVQDPSVVSAIYMNN